MLDIFFKVIARYWLTVLFIASFILCLCLGNLVNAQTLDAAQLVNQGIESYRKADFRAAIQPWRSAVELYQKSNDLQNVAIVNENLARAYQQLDNTAATLSYWEQAIAYYRSQNNWQKVGRVQTEIAQVYSSSGQTKKAISLLCGRYYTEAQEELVCQPGSALQIALKQQDKSGEVAALGSLGEAYRLQGNYDLAIKYLQTAKSNQNQTYNFAVLNSLGNAHASRAQLWNLRANYAQQQKIPKASKFRQKAIDDYQQAKEYFQLSINNQQDNKAGELRRRLNLIQLAYRTKNYNIFDANQTNLNIRKSIEIFDKLPNYINKLYAAIYLANLPAIGVEYTSPLTQCFVNRQLPEIQVKELFNKAIKVAQALQDSRSESYALGAFGHLYECQNKYQLALELTHRAIWLADQNLRAKDSLYLWEWQAGRILEAQQKINEALPFYQRAYNTLEELRSDILIANRDLQFDFRDLVEPVYRQLAKFQLELATSNIKNIKKHGQKLTSALNTINSLRLAEIQDYFGNDCILAAINKQNIDKFLSNDTAVINSIILENKSAIVITLPNGEQHLQWIYLNQDNFREEIAKFRAGIIDGQETFVYDTTQAENLYDLIVRPFEGYFKSQQIKTLVFIQDGFLRNVPMAALYDKKEKQYLIQKYAIATTPSLQLTTATKININETKALILAVTEEKKVEDQIFRQLTNVPLELQAIQKQFPKNKLLVNQDFTNNNLAKEVKNSVYPIIHIATHAQFGTIPEDTFLVTGDNNKLTINQLETLLRKTGNPANSVALLALTACETAVGDDRASLGLAGVALQAGAKSAIASLWPVGDNSTADLVAEFYNQLSQSQMSKAQALQAAQLKLINAKQIPEINDQYNHPYYWAAFIVIGNWL
ncbi:TPR repeat protein [Nostoc sp. NIES-4103]|nr:TPR repeat protein [Nostoc sp. NIES-4103]